MERGGVVILGIDTSSARTSVALFDSERPNGERVIAERSAHGAMSHGEVIATLVESVLATSFTPVAAISAVAVGTGPGPFTGLRVGIAFGQSFAWARSIPVLGVCSLDALAVEVSADEFTVVTDARRKEVYWAHYVGGRRLSEPEVCRPAEVARATLCVGQGAILYPEFFPQQSEPLFPRAANIAKLAHEAQLRGEDLPIDARYIRHPDVSI